MRKSELKPGVAYMVSTNGRVSGYSDSIFKVAEWNRRERKYIVFENGEPSTAYSSNSMVWVTSCPTYGADCPTHTEVNAQGYRRGCGSQKVRLMDIRGEFYPIVAEIARKNRERNADDGRGERYARHLSNKARREKEDIRKPITEQFYEAFNAISGAGFGRYYTDLRSLTNDQMTALTEALNQARKAVA